MRWIGSGKMKQDRKTIIYSGHSNEHILGAGLCLSLHVAKALTTRFQTRHAKVTIN